MKIKNKYCEHKNAKKITFAYYKTGKAIKKFEYLKCTKCRIVFIDPIPTRKELEKIYSYNNVQECRNPLIGKFSAVFIFRIPARILEKVHECSRVNRVKRYKRHGRILDVGCGPGRFLYVLRNDNFKLFGCDLSKQAAHEASMRLKSLGGKIFFGPVEAVKFPKNYFDVITLWHVLEHIPDIDRTFRELRRILKPGGILIIEVPSSSSLNLSLFKNYWTLLLTPEHLTFWSEDSFKRIFNYYGFIKKDFYDHNYFPFIFLSSLLNKMKKNSGSIYNNILTLVTIVIAPISIVLGILFSLIGRGDVVSVVAVKK